MMNKDRIGVLIGQNGRTKDMIEELTGTRIVIDSATGEYQVEALENAEKSINQKEAIAENLEEDYEEDVNLETDINDSSFSKWIATKIINAINIGFKPEKAVKLLDSEYSLEIIDLNKSIGGSEKKLKRMKGRLIGRNGKMRESIEKYSGAHVSIYKTKLGIIGNFDSSKIARKSVKMILEGLPHNVVFKFLQKKYKQQKEREFRENWTPTFD